MLRERTRVSDYSFIRWQMDQKCFIKSVAFDNEQDFKKTNRQKTLRGKEQHDNGRERKAWVVFRNVYTQPTGDT